MPDEEHHTLALSVLGLTPGNITEGGQNCFKAIAPS
jgi:hypothetical protein